MTSDEDAPDISAPRRSPSWILTGSLTAIGTALIVASALIGVHHPRSPADIGTEPAAAPVSVQARSGDEARTDRPVRAPRASPPVSVRLPGSRTAHIVPVSTGRSGELQPPARVDEVGWWRGGAAVGDPDGSIVLVGHVDAAGQGKGTFAALWSVRPGAIVRVGTRSGPSTRFRVTGLRSYSREHPLPAKVFDQDGTARLVLITCAGQFDTRTRHYSESLVVYAAPV